MERSRFVRELWAAFASLPPSGRLERLRLLNIAFDEDDLDRLFAQGHAGHLRHLDLPCGRWTSIGAGVLVRAPAAPHLRSLGVSLSRRAAYGETAIPEDRIAACPLLQGVTRLDLTGSEFTADDLRRLAAAGVFRQIRTLTLPAVGWTSDDELVNEWLTILADSPDFPLVHTLRWAGGAILTGNSVRPLMRLLDSPHWPHLTAVDMNLASIPNFGRLRLGRFVASHERPLWLGGLTEHPLARGDRPMRLRDIDEVERTGAPGLVGGWVELDRYFDLLRSDRPTYAR